MPEFATSPSRESIPQSPSPPPPAPLSPRAEQVRRGAAVQPQTAEGRAHAVSVLAHWAESGKHTGQASTLNAARGGGDDKHAPHKLLYVGMGDGAKDEALALAAQTPTVTVRDSDKDDTVVHDKHTYNLQGEDELAAYLMKLGIGKATPRYAELMALFRTEGSPDTRDELGQVVRAYLAAERGEYVMDRVVLSGHSVGDVIWGDHNGSINFSAFQRLAKLFPKAVGQVKDLMLSACYTGGSAQLEVYLQMFPGLESIWAYSGSSPGTASGALTHMRIWQRATKGSEVPDMAKARNEAQSTRKGDSVWTWTPEEGESDKTMQPLADLVRVVEQQESFFQEYYSGSRIESDPQGGPLRRYYQALQRLINNRDLDAGERSRWMQRRDVTIRIIFFRTVCQRFAAKYKQKLDLGYKEAKLEQPKWSELLRSRAEAEAQRVEAASSAGAAAQEAATLVRGLWELNSDIIPTNFI